MAALAFGFVLPAAAQVLYGALTGTVTDQSGGAVPNATVTLKNQNTGDIRTVTTNGSGDFLALNIQPGTYTVQIPAANGFGAFQQENVAVTVNTQVRVNVTLQPATANASVTVTTAPPLLQTETAEVNHQISSSQIEQLPITSSQGRNFQSLYALVPGTNNVTEQNSIGLNPSRAMSVNINGTEDMSNTTRIDGAINQNVWVPYLVAYVPPADSIETVNITTSSFNANQGMAGAASTNIVIKTGGNQVHGGVWEYNQLSNVNARGYTNNTGTLPKNIFNEYGANFSGPVVIPHVINGHNKLFFYEGFERTTRRSDSAPLATIPDTKMIAGDFSEVAALGGAANALLYDPQPGGVPQTGPNAVNGYLLPGFRPTFQSEYGCNCIPASRQAQAAVTMLNLLAPLSQEVGTAGQPAANYGSQLGGDLQVTEPFIYNRITNDTKVTYDLSPNTSMFGRYSVEPFNITDPQILGPAGGNSSQGLPGLSSGRIQNVGLGFSHVFTPRLILDADGGFSRLHSGTQSTLDRQLGNFGLNTLHIPGTNGPTIDYAGQPLFQFTGFTTIGNSAPASPFLFRDNQFTGDINMAWTKGNHTIHFGFSYLHSLLNHFQPTIGSNVANPRGGFAFVGGMTTGPLDNNSSGNAYLSLADFLLGLPNNGGGVSVGKAVQLEDPNTLRWSQYAGYVQDQWTVTPKLTLNYGVRYEYYGVPYKDHTGLFFLDPNLPQSGNVEIGGVNGNPKNDGIDAGWGMFLPRAGLDYRVLNGTVIRIGGGITEDPDSMRFLRDAYPGSIAAQFSGTQSGTVAVDPTQGNLPLTLSVGIPQPPVPNLSSGFVSLPVTVGTGTTRRNYRRGYVESWNLSLQQDLGAKFVANIAYVGTHQVRQLVNYTLNAAPLPSSSTICMSNGQYNPSSPWAGQCNYQANTLINMQHCNSPTDPNKGACYNTAGIGITQPMASAMYNALQTQLTRNAGRSAQFGLVYTWSHAIDYTDNGGGTGGAGTAFAYPAYFRMNRANAGYDHTNNLQFWFIYHLPFGAQGEWLQHGWAGAIFGGFQLNGQVSHVSGAPFTITPANSNGFNAPGNSLYAEQTKPYVQIGGHARVSNSAVNGGQPWFDPTAFTNVPEPGFGLPATASAQFGNTGRNQFRGPGTTVINASAFRSFHIWREAEFQVRAEAFNLLNHPQLGNPNTGVGGGTFGYITSFGATRSLQWSGRINF